MSPIADRAVLNSPLFKLPPELRDIIYEYAVGSDPKVTRKTMLSDSHCIESKDFVAKYNVVEPPLLQICRTVRREALGFFLAQAPHEVILRSYTAGKSDPNFWEDLASSLFSQSVTKSPPLDLSWKDVTGWLHEAQEVMEHGGVFSPLPWQTIKGSYW